VKRFAFGLILACALKAEDTVFELNPAKTEITFTVGDTLHTVHGTFKVKSGTIRFDAGTAKAAGEIVIDVLSGQSGSRSRDKRMQREILESQKYPEAVFVPDRVEGKLASGDIDVHGMFRIHGGEHELTMHFKVAAEGNQYKASTHFTIPYVQWGMKSPSNFLLKVDDRVEVDVKADGISGR
jgi:polyisoprenoid-binding protein YceI